MFLRGALSQCNVRTTCCHKAKPNTRDLENLRLRACTLGKRSVVVDMTRLTQIEHADARHEVRNELKTYEARGSARERTCMVRNDDNVGHESPKGQQRVSE